MARLRWKRWVREHGWVVSGSYVVLAIVLALVLSRTDRTHPIESVEVIENSAAEQLLGAIAAGMIAFTAIVFSISLVVAQFWNTAYSFRLTQWLRQTPLTAHAFGVFSATFVYAIAALLVLGRHRQASSCSPSSPRSRSCSRASSCSCSSSTGRCAR